MKSVYGIMSEFDDSVHTYVVLLTLASFNVNGLQSHERVVEQAVQVILSYFDK